MLNDFNVKACSDTVSVFPFQEELKKSKYSLSYRDT